MTTKYRALTNSEIKRLTANGNVASDWDEVHVAEGFTPDHISNCTFGRNVWIGEAGDTIEAPSRVIRKCAIRNAEVIDCMIGDGVYISNIGAYISNCIIGDGAYIENCGVIETVGISSFGNGTLVKTVNEGGGREVPIYNGMTAQIAYIMAMYRHREKCVNNIREAIRFADEKTSTYGNIGRGAMITGCATLHNVSVGEAARLEGVSVLNNGTVNSSADNPSYVGHGVKACDFVFADGSCVDKGSIIRKCFVGEGCRIDNGFSAKDSLFFANCEFEHGEAVSIFAGPYSVSHHNSSLLIAGLFSFMNAGSGTNQSNHLFKTGPVHQGIHERGCKFASNAYVMLPAREGAFTVIIGRHTSHHNTELLPFSYLTQEGEKSYLMPGATLFCYGAIRDFSKWAQRDKRKNAKGDRINFEQYNPYLGGKFVKAIALCEELLAKEGIETYTYQRVKIKQVMVRRGHRLYKLALQATLSSILSQGDDADTAGVGEWVDIAGMYAPKSRMNELVDYVESGLVRLERIEMKFDIIHENYKKLARGWALGVLEKQLGRVPSLADIKDAIEQGVVARETLDKMVADDALKDGDQLMMTGYAIDDSGNKEIAEKDFAAVRKSRL